LLKKVVVLFPYPDNDSSVASAVGQITFEAKEPNRLFADNTDKGILVVTERKSISDKGKILAVFKEWIYWKKIE